MRAASSRPLPSSSSVPRWRQRLWKASSLPLSSLTTKAGALPRSPSRSRERQSPRRGRGRTSCERRARVAPGRTSPAARRPRAGATARVTPASDFAASPPRALQYSGLRSDRRDQGVAYPLRYRKRLVPTPMQAKPSGPAPLSRTFFGVTHPALPSHGLHLCGGGPRASAPRGLRRSVSDAAQPVGALPRTGLYRGEGAGRWTRITVPRNAADKHIDIQSVADIRRHLRGAGVLRRMGVRTRFPRSRRLAGTHTAGRARS